MVDVTNVKMNINEAKELPTMVDLDNDARVDFSDNDGRILVLLKNSHATTAQTVTIANGGGIQGVDTYNQSISIDAGKTVAIQLESGVFRNVKGDNKGYVVLSTTGADISIGCIVLP